MILISPYIKLSYELKRVLEAHRNKPKLELTIVYGKNEEDKRRSISDDDYDFFKTFSSVSIRYHKRLHAKMYANDFHCLITSMNLHDYSLKENIETGILTQFRSRSFASKLLSPIAPKLFIGTLDIQAKEFVHYIVNKSTIEFERRCKRERSMFGLVTAYSEGQVSVDKARTGYCIRTKETIPFNPTRPYSKAAYDIWVIYGNINYKERYCHACGNENPSTMIKPVCDECIRKTWK